MATGLEATDDNGERRTDNHFYENSGMAYFWPSWEETPVPNKRVLQGELELLRILKPSFKFPNFTIRVRTISSLIRKPNPLMRILVHPRSLPFQSSRVYSGSWDADRREVPSISV